MTQIPMPKAKSEKRYSTSALASALAALQARAVSRALPIVEQGDLLYPLRVLREQYLQGAFIPVEQVPDWLAQHLRDGRPLPTLTLTIAPEAESRVLEAIRTGAARCAGTTRDCDSSAATLPRNPKIQGYRLPRAL